MPFTTGERYAARVTDAYMTKFKTGTQALFIGYQTAAGPTDRAWPVTVATVVDLRKRLNECFGITEAQLCDKAFLASVGDFLRNKECSIVMKEEEYEGTPRMVVQWMNPVKHKRAGEIDIQGAADIFGGGIGSSSEPPPPPQFPDDEQVPF